MCTETLNTPHSRDDYFFGDLGPRSETVQFAPEQFIARAMACPPDHFKTHLNRLFKTYQCPVIFYETERPNFGPLLHELNHNDLSLIEVRIVDDEPLSVSLVYLEGRLVLGGEWASNISKDPRVLFSKIIAQFNKTHEYKQRTIIVRGKTVVALQSYDSSKVENELTKLLSAQPASKEK